MLQRDHLGNPLRGPKKGTKRKAAKDKEGSKKEEESPGSPVIDATNVHIFIDLVNALGESEDGYHFKRYLPEDRLSAAEIERIFELEMKAIIEKKKLQASGCNVQRTIVIQ